MMDPLPIQSPTPLTLVFWLEAGHHHPLRLSFFQARYKQIMAEAQMSTFTCSGEDFNWWQLTAADYTGKILCLVGFKQDIFETRSAQMKQMQ